MVISCRPRICPISVTSVVATCLLVLWSSHPHELPRHPRFAAFCCDVATLAKRPWSSSFDIASAETMGCFRKVIDISLVCFMIYGYHIFRIVFVKLLERVGTWDDSSYYVVFITRSHHAEETWPSQVFWAASRLV